MASGEPGNQMGGAHWALEATTDNVILVDRDFRITFVNRATARLNGFAPESVVGRTLWEQWPGNLGTDIERNYRHAMATGEPVRFVHGYFEEGKFDLWLEIHAYPSPDGLAIFFHDVSDAKREAAREADDQERLASAIRATELGTWRCDLPLDENPFDWSPQVRRHFGIGPDEPVGVKEFLELLHPDDRQMTADAMARAIDGREPYDVVYRTLGRDGKIRWIRATGNAFYRSDGAPYRFDGFTVELTERVAMEEALREREATLRAALDASIGGFYSVDHTGNTTVCNAAFLRMLGFAGAEDAVGRKLHDVIHHTRPDGSPYPKEECPIYRAAGGGPAAHVLGESFFRLDGTAFPVEYWTAPILVDGEVRGAVTTFVDVTERLLADEERERLLEELTVEQGRLRASEERFRAAQETTPDPFTIIEAVRDAAGEVVDFRWTFVNEATGRLTGETAEELVGSLVSVRRLDVRETDLYRAWLRTLATGEPFSHEVFMDFPSGRTYLRLTGVRVGDGIATSFTDLTQRRLNEERLEIAVADRTAQLQAAVKEAEGFNYSIAHDLRSPLRAIASTSSILLEEAGPELGDDHRELLRRQNDNAGRLGRLIDELLRLSRLARAEVKREPLDLTAMARAVFGDLADQGRAERCVLDAQQGMTAEGDAGLVRTVLHNLVGNACKFSPSGGTIRVREEGGVFSVADEGVGFDMAFAPKIFLPFERLVTEDQFEGTGIGLANVERIVRRHGGRVWVESEPGRGTTFYFTLA